MDSSFSYDQSRAAEVMGKFFISPEMFSEALRGQVQVSDEEREVLKTVPWVDAIMEEELQRGEAILFSVPASLTFPTIRQTFGANPKSQPCLNKLGLGSSGDPFSRPSAGWHLVRTRLEPGSTKKIWTAQAELIPETHKRTCVLEIALARLLVYRMQGKRIFEGTWAWCEDVAADGRRVLVGPFGRGGIRVLARQPSISGSNIGLALSRK